MTLLKKPALLSALEQKLELAKTMFKTDAEIFNEIETKISKGKALQDKADALLSQKEFSKEDISEKAQAIVNDMKTAKIEIPQKEALVSLEKSYKWMEKFYNFWLKKQPAIPYDTMEIETSKSNTKSKEPFTLEHSWKVCLNSSVFENEFNKQGQELSQIIKNGQVIKHSDLRIQEVFYKYAQLVWNRETASSLSKVLITPKELHSLVETAQLYHIDEKNPTLIELKKIEGEYQEVMEGYFKFKNSDEYVNLIEQTNTEELALKIKNLKMKLQELKVRNEDAIQTIVNANLIVEWVTKARSIQKLHQQGKRLNYTSLKEILHMGSLVKIPNDNQLFQFIKTLLDSLSSVMDQYNKYKKSQGEFNEILKSINQSQDEKARKKLLMEANKKKPTADECKHLLRAIKSSNISIEASEIERMESDIAKTVEWLKEFEVFLEENQLDTGKYNLSHDNAALISDRLASFRNQLMSLPLQIENAEGKLFVYEWNFQALAKLSGVGDSHGIKDWVSLIKKADEAKQHHPELHESNLYRDINEQAQLSKKLSSQINDYRNIEEKLSNMLKTISHARSDKFDQLSNYRKDLKSMAELKRLNDDITKCKIDMAEEKKYIQDILTKGKKALELYHQYCVENLEKGVKEPMKNFMALQEAFRKLPISYSNEERNLDQLIHKAQSLQKGIDDSKHQFRGSKLEFKLTQLAIEQYKQLPIIIKEVEAIQKEFNVSKEVMNSVSKEVEQHMMDSNLDFSGARELAKRVDKINMDMGDELEDLQCNVWNLQVESLKRNEENLSNGATETPRITYSLLKAVLAEGYSLLVSKNAIAKLRENIIYTEQLLLKAEAELKDLYNIKNTEILEAFHSSHQSFVDIKEEIIEYKVQLGLDPNYQSSVDSPVKNIFQYSDEEIISLFKSEKALTTGLADSKQAAEPPAKGKKDKKAAGSESGQKKIVKPVQRERRRVNPSKQLLDESFQYERKLGRMSPEASAERDDGDWELKKKVKLDASGQSADKIIEKTKVLKKVALPEIKQKKVTEDVRQDNRKKFGSSIKQNPHFGDLSEDQVKKYSKDIEVNLFSEYHENYSKYTEKSEKIRTFFDKIKKYKALSKMISTKQFSIEVLNNLSKAEDSKLSEFDQKAEARLKGSQAKKPKPPVSQKSNANLQLDELRMLLGGSAQAQAPSRFQALVTQPKKEPEKKEPPVTVHGKMEPLSPEEDKNSKYKKKTKTADELAAFSDEEEEKAHKNLARSKGQKASRELSMEEMIPEDNVSKSKKEAILFDPDEDENESSKNPNNSSTTRGSYDPFSVDVYNAPQQETFYKLETEEIDYPKGSVLKVHHNN